eukprot:469676-Pleurochrysis_carterae.AAC.9
MDGQRPVGVTAAWPEPQATKALNNLTPHFDSDSDSLILILSQSSSPSLSLFSLIPFSNLLPFPTLYLHSTPCTHKREGAKGGGKGSGARRKGEERGRKRDCVQIGGHTVVRKSTRAQVLQQTCKTIAQTPASKHSYPVNLYEGSRKLKRASTHSYIARAHVRRSTCAHTTFTSYGPRPCA